MGLRHIWVSSIIVAHLRVLKTYLIARIWVCVECSGKHRLLGLHLSQIKSITMDKWSEKEVQKVRAGGNKNFKEFLEAHDDYIEEWTIEEKYNSMVNILL